MNHFFPMHHASIAFDRVLNMGAGIPVVVPQIAALVILTVFWFTAGLLLFGRRHMRWS